MHKKQLLIRAVAGLIGFASVSLFPAKIFGQKREISGFISLQQETALTVGNLKKNLKKEKNLSARFALIEKYKKDSAVAHKAAAAQSPEDEIYIKQLESAFDLLPKEAEFKKKECKKYRLKILFEMHPNEKEPIQDPVQQALDVLKILCDSKI